MPQSAPSTTAEREPRRRRKGLVISASVAVVAAGLAVVGQNFAHAADSCLQSGTEKTINDALDGADAVASLCPGAVFDLSGPVRFTAAGQHIETAGLPSDDTRALL